MCSGIKKVFDAVVRAVKKVWDVIRKYIVYIVVVAAIFWPMLLPYLQGVLSAYPALLAWLPTTGVWAAGATSLSAMAWRGVAALAVGFLFDTEASKDIVGKIGEIAGNVASSAGEIVGDVVGGAASGLLSSPWALVAGAFAVWWFFIRDDSADEERRRQRLENDILEASIKV